LAKDETEPRNIEVNVDYAYCPFMLLPGRPVQGGQQARGKILSPLGVVGTSWAARAWLHVNRTTEDTIDPFSELLRHVATDFAQWPEGDSHAIFELLSRRRGRFETRRFLESGPIAVRYSLTRAWMPMAIQITRDSTPAKRTGVE